MSCESDHIFKDLENDKVVFIRLAKYGLDSIPPDIAKLKKVEELTISLDSSDGWTIYPPASAIVQMVDKPPFYQLPKQLTQLKDLKKLNLSGLKIKSLPINFTELIKLEYLDLSMNKLDIKKELPKLKSLPNLKILSIMGNKIDTTLIKRWQGQNPKVEVIL